MSPLLSLLEGDSRVKGRIVLSTVTLTGQEAARRECRDVSRIIYFPLDLPLAVSRAIRRIGPGIFITAETEIWPNFFHSCFRRSIPVVVVNGRISDSSFARYLRFRWFFRPLLEKVSAFLMQSEEDARRILQLGARPETVKVTGNMKYDRVPETVSLPGTVNSWAEGGFLVVAGSTHRNEEEAILGAMEGFDRRAEVLTALVPRHPERFDEVAGLLEKRGLAFTRYSDVTEDGVITSRVLLVDAMGVLDGFYALADVAFVGGSLVPVGGHNLLEPAMHGVPVLSGPHTHNFRDIAENLIEAGGCVIVNSAEQVSSIIRSYMSDPGLKDETGRSALEASKKVSGASKRNFDEILGIITGSPPGTGRFHP
jgi:3-deoxy-D-manno-octulosonic-acid transferase